jgi:hypothetical protein
VRQSAGGQKSQKTFKNYGRKTYFLGMVGSGGTAQVWALDHPVKEIANLKIEIFPTSYVFLLGHDFTSC